MAKFWEKAEIKTAKKTGGRRTPASGSKWGFRGDVKTDYFLVDDKTTEHKSFSIPIKMWNKIRKEAILEQRKPALKVTFTEGTSFVCIEEDDFYRLNEILSGIKI